MAPWKDSDGGTVHAVTGKPVTEEQSTGKTVMEELFMAPRKDSDAGALHAVTGKTVMEKGF